MERYELRVDGMSCEGCEDQVDRALGTVEGVKRTDADHATGTVEIAAESGTEDAARRAIHDAGYDVVG
ncbi:MAG: heavy-metal-associated domain-containing protein [Euryarchaeota archaeon]|jgi:copper chaperone|nr:heavy-metal-associated domain-containing protein [Euryarchaeota archaeon]